MARLRSDLVGTAAVTAVIVCWLPNLARAGPPLIADDPNTVGPGVVQPIFAVSTIRQGDETLVRAPTADVTIGLVDSLDATLVASLASLHDASENPRWALNGLFAVGVKWEFFRGERGSLAFSPALVMSAKSAKQPTGLLPIQGELAVGQRKVAIGFDLGYVPVRGESDEWFVALYANWAATRRLNVLGEVWAVSFGRAESADIGTSLGIDYGLRGNELRLLAALGTGIVSVGGSRIDIRAYLGAQFTFGTPRDRWRSTRSRGVK